MFAAGGEIAIPPESQVITASVRRFRTLQYLGWKDLVRLTIALFESGPNYSLWEVDLSHLHRELFNIPKDKRSLALIIDFIMSVYRDTHFPRAKIWGDKSPLNSLHLPWIYKTFPEAKYLHLLRDGRDAVSSMAKRGRTLEQATYKWMRAVKEAEKLGKRLSKNRFLTVRYEDLVENPHDTMNEICDFLSVNYTPDMLDFYKFESTKEATTRSHHSNLKRPLFTESVGKWKERLKKEEQIYVLNRIGPTLKRFGYD